MQVCEQGELISWKNTQGTVLYIAFKQLAPRTPLTSILDGERTIISRIRTPSPFQGCAAISFSPKDHNISYTFIGDIDVPDDPAVRKGQPIAWAADTGARAFGTYALVFAADEEVLRRLFPAAFSKQPTRVSYEGPQASGPLITNPNYRNSP